MNRVRRTSLNLRKEKVLEECVANALKQVKENNYAAELIEKEFPKGGNYVRTDKENKQRLDSEGEHY